MKLDQRFRYLGPTEQLAERLARLERRRLNLLAEERAVARFLAAHPDLAENVGLTPPASPGSAHRLRLVVNNASCPLEDGDGPRAA
jgi:hypothetical protein